jgi:phosphatidylglycerophosphate synthase
MRKLPSLYENPIDDILLDLCESACPFFSSYNFTPNHITTFSLMFGIISVVCLYKGYVLNFAITFFISYFFDCLDGHYARKYNLVTEFGDYYDHVKDISITILLICVIFHRYRNCSSKNLKFAGVIFLIFLFLALVHIGCQEKVYIGNSETLGGLKHLCSRGEDIKWSKYFGIGTFNIIFVLLVIYMEQYQNNNTCQR